MAHRPASGSSTRSRRDEVWEMKRQRFLARKRGEEPGVGAGRSRPPALGQDPFAGASASQAPVVEASPPSPLSQLVARGGYQQAQPSASSVHQPYGERPSSGSAAAFMQHPGSRGSQQGQHGAYAGGGGFDAGVAGQWNANVQQTRQNQQNRHDPSVCGPSMPSGGQRITQAPGGGSNIDLSWGGGAAHPPRIPGGTPVGGPGVNHRQQVYDNDPRAVGGPGSRGSGAAFAAPWGRDDDNLPSRQSQARRDACPFGTDAAAAPPPRAPFPQGNGLGAGENFFGGTPKSNAAAGSYSGVPQAAMRSGSRGRADVAAYAPEAPVAGGRVRRPPGGQSQVVLG